MRTDELVEENAQIQGCEENENSLTFHDFLSLACDQNIDAARSRGVGRHPLFGRVNLAGIVEICD
jgi:hypothetical protein